MYLGRKKVLCHPDVFPILEPPNLLDFGELLIFLTLHALLVFLRMEELDPQGVLR